MFGTFETKKFEKYFSTLIFLKNYQGKWLFFQKLKKKYFPKFSSNFKLHFLFEHRFLKKYFYSTLLDPNHPSTPSKKLNLFFKNIFSFKILFVHPDFGPSPPKGKSCAQMLNHPSVPSIFMSKPISMQN